ncbi:SUPPRESSOR OF GAMMA RESPONSE 1 isoform X1 [Eucalyptus grandis]|uniref:SUPPRESSOR OF GAMMA RESPONSE 1 isoform X1 n=1 Tax=Eucalyptus grandis TaxID=71139 RepID=UPI00052626DE|nr:SUPPRESSOR OF GAMMA RESPONSE 1 isoform X1 [Eucalyptus grandis]
MSRSARSWLVDGRSIAKKVKNATLSTSCQIKDCGANRECPNCHFFIDNTDVSPEWPGLPAGVKFDPSDGELLEHLAAKCGIGNSRQHVLIDEFIPTLEWNEGICYTHPENLPGVNKDGRSVHFFHRTMNAYATGQRKRRKIHDQHNLNREDVRWHKTGKTKPVAIDGVHIGWQKIMVLYKSSKKGSKAAKSNWVMHQYHLGADKEEKDGEYVVSKIFLQQPKETEKNNNNNKENNESMDIDYQDVTTLQTNPRTPKPNPLNPHQTEKFGLLDDVAEGDMKSSDQDIFKDIQLEDDELYPEWLAGESQPLEDFDFGYIDGLLFHEEPSRSHSPSNDRGCNLVPPTSLPEINEVVNEVVTDENATYGISELAKLDFDSPPDFLHPELPFGSQEGIFEWLGRI